MFINPVKLSFFVFAPTSVFVFLPPCLLLFRPHLSLVVLSCYLLLSLYSFLLLLFVMITGCSFAAGMFSMGMTEFGMY
jgi:hypothetical protein